MDSIQFDELKRKIITYLKCNLKDTRYEHTINVATLAKKMAKVLCEDEKKAEIAALLHDMARNISMEQMNKYVEEFELPERYKGNINLAHGKIGSILAKKEFGIDNEDILNAISFHTTGRKEMSQLEKIIFLSDAIEPNRKYSGVTEIRKQAEDSIDKACLLSLKGTVNYINSQGVYLDKDTIEAKEYLEHKLLINEEKGGKNMESRELADVIAKALDDKKGIDITIIDIAEKSSFADYFVLVSAGSERQAKALKDAVEDTLEPQGIFPKNIEGKNKPTWILMDYRDVIVNIMTTESREKYSLEKIWGDCEIILCN